MTTMGTKVHASDIPTGWQLYNRDTEVEGWHGKVKNADVFRSETGDYEVVAQHVNEEGISRVMLRRSKAHPLYSGTTDDIVKEWKYVGVTEGQSQATTAMRIADDLTDDDFSDVPWE